MNADTPTGARGPLDHPARLARSRAYGRIPRLRRAETLLGAETERETVELALDLVTFR